MPKSTTSLTSLAMCFLLMIVGVPEAVYSSNIDCNFSNQRICHYANDPANDLVAWRWTSVEIPNPLATVAKQRTDAICLLPIVGGRSSSIGQTSLSGKLWFPGWITAPSNGDSSLNSMCLGFSLYFTSGASLTLLKRSRGSCISDSELSNGQKVMSHLCKSFEIWRSAVSVGSVQSGHSNWNTIRLSVALETDFKLIFEGTIPANNPNARICVDNITAYHRPCHQIAASAYEASMRRWLEPIVFIFIGALAFALLIAVVIFAIRVNRRRGKKLSPGGSSGGSVDGSASPQRLTTGGRQHHHRRQQEAMLLHAERLADGPAASVVPIGHGHGPRRPAPPVPAAQPSLDELLLDSGHQAAAAAAAAACNDPPPRYEEAMGLVGAASSATAGQQQQQQPPPHPPRLNRGNGAFVV